MHVTVLNPIAVAAAALQLNSVAVIGTEAATPIIAHAATIVGVNGITVGVIATLVYPALVCIDRCCGGNNRCCGCPLSPRGCRGLVSACAAARNNSRAWGRVLGLHATFFV